MMKIFKVGDSLQAICNHCRSLEKATFKLRDVPFSDGSGVVKNVLVGVCNTCDEVCLLPQQSAPAVNKQLNTQRKPVESRLPAHFIDILNLAAYELGGSPDFVTSLMKYYIHRLASDEKSAANLASLLDSELAQGRADKRLSLKGRRILTELETLKSTSHIKSTTDLIKGVILKINDDILVNKRPNPTKELQSILAAVA